MTHTKGALPAPTSRHEETTWRIEDTHTPTFVTKIDDDADGIQYRITQIDRELWLTSEAAAELHAALGTALNWPPGGIPHDRL